MGGIIVFIFWVIIIVISVAGAKRKSRTPASNNAPQNNTLKSKASIHPTENTKSMGSVRETGRYGQSTGRYGQSMGNYGQGTGRYGQSMGNYGQSTGRYGQKTGKQNQSTGRYGQKIEKQNQSTGNYRQKQTKPEEDILARANRNAQQQFAEDALEKEQKVTESKRTKKDTMPDYDNGNLLDEVFDLMITGPDTSTYFGRDFVAEGIEMVNRSMGNL